MRIVAGPNTPVVNLKRLLYVLKSKDENLWEESKWMFDGSRRYLDGETNASNKIAFCSFPRSGNTFLRKYLELLSGIETGADLPLHVNVMLQMAGLKGEEIVNDTVWVVKSHTPWYWKKAIQFTANKMIVVVRNPLDSCMSYLHMTSCLNHSGKTPFDFETAYPNFFDWWVKHCCTKIKEWMAVTMNDAKFRNIPVLFVRFEDLVMNPAPEL